MGFEINPEREAYINSRGCIVLDACPGSGKTTTIAHKLGLIINNWRKDFAANTGVACISFTNVAKDEINQKFREENGSSITYPHLVSTIDSFINSLITLPHFKIILPKLSKLNIVDDTHYITSLVEKFVGSSYFRLTKKYAPHLLEIHADNSFYWDGNLITEDTIKEYARKAKKIQFNYGILKSSDSAYLALNILRKEPRIAALLSKRFPYLIVDEAQDTSEIQHEIISILAQNGLKNIELVGDPYQAIFEWRNAEPKFLIEKKKDASWQPLNLTNNRRSTQNIVDTFSVLRNASEYKIKSTNEKSVQRDVLVIKHREKDFKQPIQYFQALCKEYGLKDYRVVARGNTAVNEILGRPNHDQIKLWNSSTADLLIRSKHLFDSGNIAQSIKNLRRQIVSLKNPNLIGNDLRELCESLEDNRVQNGLLVRLLRSIPDFNLSVEDWTSKTEILISELFEIEKCNLELRRITSRTFKPAYRKKPLSDFFNKNDYISTEKVSNIHRVKGMTFDALLFVMGGSNSGEGVSVKSIKAAVDIPKEKQRLIYVALSRPQEFLAIAIPSTVENVLIEETLNGIKYQIVELQ